MSKELLISSTSVETRLAILEDDKVTEIFIERAKNRRILGNIYKGKVTRVLPGMQAAFVNIGLPRDTFLYVSDFPRISRSTKPFSRTKKGTSRVRSPKGLLKSREIPTQTHTTTLPRGRWPKPDRSCPRVWMFR